MKFNFLNRNKKNYLVGKSQNYWKRAKKVIPGGNMLLSKRAELFLPDFWPSYFSRAKGCHIWDLDNRKLIDLSIMGIGTNILGYGNKYVDRAVQKTVLNGNLSTLNCPEEVLLAEKLIDLHPWASKVRFARTGGEANAIAIRIARAATGKDKIAICGYHGWHDWYLATNLKDEKQLEEHLLPGLEPNGVPKSLKGTVLPFSFNNIAQLENIVEKNDLAAIKMEVQRNEEPMPGFLERIREICDKKNIVLIFDECTSGFRETFGGIHKKFKVNPDLAMFGKALGNGYAITAVIGTEDIMDAVQKTFISSTFWTERIGPTAALKTLEIMEKHESWKFITNLGTHIKKNWETIADSNQVAIKQNGIPALANFSFLSEKNLEYKTYITQEMLKEGYLVGNSIYVSIKHSKKILIPYFDKLNDLFSNINLCEKNQLNINDLLIGDVCHSTFKRLN